MGRYDKHRAAFGKAWRVKHPEPSLAVSGVWFRTFSERMARMTRSLGQTIIRMRESFERFSIQSQATIDQLGRRQIDRRLRLYGHIDQVQL